MTTYVRTRTVVSLRRGARIGLVVALLFVVYAAFRAWAPVDITGLNGVQFDCGSVVHPPSTSFQRSTCGSRVDHEQSVVVFTLIAALVLVSGSAYAFGVDRRREQYVLEDNEDGEPSPVPDREAKKDEPT